MNRTFNSTGKADIGFSREINAKFRLRKYVFYLKSKIHLCTSQFQDRPSPPLPQAIPGHLTYVKLRTVGNLTQNEAHPVGHLIFVSKRLSAVGNKKDFAILWYSTWAVFTGHCSCWFHVGFSVVVVFYIVIPCMPLFKAWCEDKPNKKFVVPENYLY